MRYATWSVYFLKPDSKEGFTPEGVIRQRGGEANGAFGIGEHTFVGYVSDNADLSGLDNFNVIEITETEVLTLSSQQGINASIAEDGSISIPSPAPLPE